MRYAKVATGPRFPAEARGGHYVDSRTETESAYSCRRSHITLICPTTCEPVPATLNLDRHDSRMEWMMATQTLSTEYPTPARQSAPSTPGGADRAVRMLADRLALHSIDALRVSLGLVFFAFGVLKFFPGASPAEGLAVRTLDTLTFGVLSGDVALLATAVTECFIGVTLVTGKLLKTGLVVLSGALVGIIAPLVLFIGDMFPDGTPTLEAQYVVKDIVLAAAALVIAAHALGARLRRD